MRLPLISVTISRGLSPAFSPNAPAETLPIIAPGEGEDINTSDPDLVEWQGEVYLYYSIGDQRTYAKLKRAVFDDSLPDFLLWCYEA